MISILCLSVAKILNSLRCQYLYITLRNVKTYSAIFAIPIIAHCNYNELDSSLHHTLAIGEHVELSTDQVIYYNIGNKEILASSTINERNVLVIKALSKGTSEVLLKFNKKSVIHQFTIITKEQQKKITQLKTKLKSFGLNIAQTTDLIYVTGEIYKLSELQEFLNIKNQYEEIQIKEINISKKNQNNHIAEIYSYFWKDGIKDVACDYHQLTYICYYHSNELSGNLKKILSDFNFLKIIKLENTLPPKECIQLNIWQYSHDENSPNLIKENGYEINLLSPKSFIKKPINLILDHITDSAKLISNQNIYLTPGKKANFSSGIKIPIINRNENTGTTATQYQFIGFSTELDLIQRGALFELEIDNKISSPIENNSITFDQVKTTLSLGRSEEIIFFTHQLAQATVGQSALIPLPLIKNIEILKVNKNRITNKNLIGTVQLKERCDE